MTFEEWWNQNYIGPGSAIGIDKAFAKKYGKNPIVMPARNVKT
jgi:hypothetical protein